MYKLLHDVSARDSFRTEAAPVFGAGVIAEFFFKWHSFTLECLGFLTVWYAFGWLLASWQNRRAVTPLR